MPPRTNEETIAKYAVDANLLRLGSFNPEKKIQSLFFFFFLYRGFIVGRHLSLGGLLLGGFCSSELIVGGLMSEWLLSGGFLSGAFDLLPFKCICNLVLNV